MKALLEAAPARPRYDRGSRAMARMPSGTNILALAAELPFLKLTYRHSTGATYGSEKAPPAAAPCRDPMRAMDLAF